MTWFYFLPLLYPLNKGRHLSWNDRKHKTVIWYLTPRQRVISFWHFDSMEKRKEMLISVVKSLEITFAWLGNSAATWRHVCDCLLRNLNLHMLIWSDCIHFNLKSYHFNLSRISITLLTVIYKHSFWTAAWNY